jgi:hypothetical protein
MGELRFEPVDNIVAVEECDATKVDKNYFCRLHNHQL